MSGFQQQTQSSRSLVQPARSRCRPPHAVRATAPTGPVAEFGNVAVHGVRPIAISRVAPMIQRSAKWNGIIGPHDNINVAETVFGGPRPVSWAMLNGTMLKQVSHADDAIKGKEPTVKTRASKKGAKAKLTSAPTQEGAVDETVVSHGPWTKAMKKSEVGAIFNLPACAGGTPTTFSAKGVRTDKEVADANLRHENKHCADIEDAFKDTVVAWDKKVQAAKKAGTEYEGTDAPDATTNLWAAIGDTPTEMSRKFRALSLSKGDDFHSKPEGKEMNATRAWSSADCSTCGVDVVNPS